MIVILRVWNPQYQGFSVFKFAQPTFMLNNRVNYSVETTKLFHSGQTTN